MLNGMALLVLFVYSQPIVSDVFFVNRRALDKYPIVVRTGKGASENLGL